MKKLFLSMAVIAAFGIASCGAEKEDAKKEGKEEKKELSKTEKIANELCACNEKEAAEIAQCMQEVQSNHADVTQDEIKEIMEHGKECVEEMNAKMQSYQEEKMKEAVANDTLSEEPQIESTEVVEETK